jgi:hypothetical protein
VTTSRDTQEIHPLSGVEMLKIFNEYPYETSILDDFNYFEKKQDSIMTVGKNMDNPRNQMHNQFPMNQMNMNKQWGNVQNMQFMGGDQQMGQKKFKGKNFGNKFGGNGPNQYGMGNPNMIHNYNINQNTYNMSLPNQGMYIPMNNNNPQGFSDTFNEGKKINKNGFNMSEHFSAKPFYKKKLKKINSTENLIDTKKGNIF